MGMVRWQNFAAYQKSGLVVTSGIRMFNFLATRKIIITIFIKEAPLTLVVFREFLQHSTKTIYYINYKLKDGLTQIHFE